METELGRSWQARWCCAAQRGPALGAAASALLSPAACYFRPRPTLCSSEICTVPMARECRPSKSSTASVSCRWRGSSSMGWWLCVLPSVLTSVQVPSPSAAGQARQAGFAGARSNGRQAGLLQRRTPTPLHATHTEGATARYLQSRGQACPGHPVACPGAEAPCLLSPTHRSCCWGT